MNNNNLMKFTKKRKIKLIFGTILGNVLYSLSVVWLLDLGKFYAGGVTGISELIKKLLEKIDIYV